MLMSDIKFDIPSLSQRAMLVRLKRSMYQPYAHDPQMTAKVEQDTGVRKAGRFNKRLFLDCYLLTDTNSAFNDAYAYVQRNTVPWFDDGFRMLPAAQYFDFTAGVRELLATAKRKADNLAVHWQYLVAKDMERLGPLADPNDYPQDIRSHYDISIKFMPVPDTNDFRVAITEEDKQTLNDQLAEAEANVSKYLLVEMLKPIQHAAEKLAVPIGEKGSFFRDSLMNNITEVLERARKLNISNDPKIAEMVDEINAAMRGYTAAPDLLREDIGARSDAQAKLDAIMAKMRGLY